ncbi:hypothetical protein [Ensifer sp. LC163]|uniref:hypothetical protein n=1 Tax=Ensifer sp. LC163 TaxID=1120652 RepID=UPI0008139F4F|nr:hypothetical protein [Ensifer sp. LC163]OCP36139.1 hypothetical protein BC360_25715 [Ensifer sp. LC163]
MNEIRRIESLGKIAGEVAHDFGNIISTLSGNLHLLETAGPTAAATLRQKMGATAELGATLVQRLLAFARNQLQVFGAIGRSGYRALWRKRR